MSAISSNRLLKQYQRFVEVSHNLASTLDLEKLLHNIMDVAVDLVEAEEASILLYDQHTHRLSFETATNADSSPQLQNMTVPEESIAGWVALNRLPQIINNVSQDDRHFENVDQQTNFRTRSMVAVPLIAKNRLIGVLEVLNKKNGHFNEEDQEILLALAAQAAVAIENSRLFEQLDSIAEFVHELRTPLASIYASSYLLKRPELSASQRTEIAQTIHHETQRLNELTSIFLDLSRLESGRAGLSISVFSLADLLQECLQILQPQAAEKRVALHFSSDPLAQQVHADRDKLKQVFLNLLNNAVKYNRVNGSIWVRLRVQPPEWIVSIQDSGIGIPPDQLPRMFTRFFRASNADNTIVGTGLGLSIARRIVELHGGQVTVESELNVGTTFTIQAPIHAEP